MIHTLANVFLFVLLSTLGLVSKAQEKHITLKGVLVDSLSSEFISGVSITVLENEVVIQQLKNLDNGMFFLKIQEGKTVNVEFSHLNYNTKRIVVSSSRDSNNIDLGLIYLVSQSKLLATATVTGTPPQIRKKIDRIEFDVQQDPDKDIYNLLDMLQKVPLISVDGQDNISIKGESDFGLLINGKSSALFSGNPGMALKMMPSKEILRIEVITSPPSKYDSEGVGGLINIVTKKKTDDGYNVYIGTAYNYPYGPLGSISVDAKKDKMQLSVLASTFFQSTPNNSVENAINFVDSGTIQQRGNQRFDGNSSLFRGQLLYESDSLNIFSLGGSWKQDQFDMTSSIINSQSDREGDFTVLQNGQPYWNTVDFDLNYQKGFKRNPKEFLNFSYKHLSSSNEVRDNLQYKGVDWPENYQRNEFGFNENSIQVDYEKQSGGLLIESGGQFIARNSNSTYEYTNMDQGEFNFAYNVYNLYHTMGYEKGNWSVKGGVRMDVMSFSDKNSNQRDRFNVLPSLAIQKSFADHHSFGLTYNERIQRPNISQVSPFVDLSNPNLVTSGNPDLAPTIGRNINLSYSYINKLSIIADLGYYHTDNAIQQVYNTVNDSMINMAYENIGRERSYDANINFGYTFKKVRFSLNGRISYVYMEGIQNGVPIENSGNENSASFTVSVPFSDTFRSNLAVRYRGPERYLQGNSNSYTSSSISLTKQFFDKKLSVFASINNPFETYYINRNFYLVPSFSSHTFTQQNYRTVVVSLSYSFGQSNLKTKKIKKKVDNTDQNSIEVDPLK